MTLKYICLGIFLLVIMGSLSSCGDAVEDERIAVTMTAENEIKIFMHGIYSDGMATGLRNLVDGDAAPLMDLAGIPAENRTIFINEIKKVCSDIKCGDGMIVKDDLIAFSRFVEGSNIMLDLLQDSGVINVTAKINDLEPQGITMISFHLTTEEGKVNGVFPVASDYNLNFRFTATPPPSTVSFFFTGKQHERKVLFSFTSLLGWEASVKDGITSQTVRQDYPSSGYITIEGEIASVTRPVMIVTTPKQVDPVCMSGIAIVIILSAAGMYLAFRRMKKPEKKGTVLRGTRTEPAKTEKLDAKRYEIEGLKDLLDQGIITREEYEQKLDELNAKN